jgi:hypothetical protein
MKPNFQNEMQVEAYEAAEPKAHEAAQNSATELAREICAGARKIAGHRYRFPTEKFIREIGETHAHRRSFAERVIDRKLRAQPFDGKSFHGLREALTRRFQSGWRP